MAKRTLERKGPDDHPRQRQRVCGPGLRDAEERQTKLRLAYALNTILDEQRLTQAAAAARLGLNQPKVSALRNYRLDGFSVERLMTLLTALGPGCRNRHSREAALARGGAHQRGGGVRRLIEEECGEGHQYVRNNRIRQTKL